MFAVVLLTLRDTLIHLDRDLFRFINSAAASPDIDWLFLALRNALTWIPLYAFMLYWLLSRHKKLAWRLERGAKWQLR